MKRILLSFAILATGASALWARTESALPDLNFGRSSLGTWYGSTCPANNGQYPYSPVQPTTSKPETRQITVTNEGFLKTSQSVNLSTNTSAASSTQTAIVDGFFGGVSASTVNPNVWQVAVASVPFRLKTLYFGTGTSAERVRIWDTRGSTATAPIFDITGSSLTTAPIPLDYDCSSGVTLMKGGSGNITVTGSSGYRH